LKNTQNSISILLEQEFKDSGEIIEFLENLIRFDGVYTETMNALLKRSERSIPTLELINIINDSFKEMENKQIYKLFKTTELLLEHVLKHDQAKHFTKPVENKSRTLFFANWPKTKDLDVCRRFTQMFLVLK
jgi:hypothetical protein